jgi:hypothetical protein
MPRHRNPLADSTARNEPTIWIGRSALRAIIGTALLLAACSSEQMPTVPSIEPPGPDLSGVAFHLTIDVQSGKVSVKAPKASTATRGGAAAGLSFSLIGDEILTLLPTDCTWTAVPRNSGKRRCSFELSLQNRLGQTDLMSPTTFPRAPSGIPGIVVFPFSAAALGVPGGTATPTADWDNAPANFFNDFAGCTGGKTSDCYRSETYPGPLYAGETTAPRTVGFEVDKDAQSVSVYVVVAADLRDNPLQEITLTGNPNLCGLAEKSFTTGNVFVLAGSVIAVGPRDGQQTGRVDRGFCGFDLPDVRVAQATLQVYQEQVTGTPYVMGDVMIVDHLDFGPSIDAGDYDLAPLQADIGTLSADATVEWKSLDVTTAVRNDLANGRATARFRLQFRNDAGSGRALLTGFTDFDGNPTDNPPQLLLTFRLR